MRRGLLALWIVLAGALSASSDDPRPRWTAGATFDRELSAGTTDSFPVDLESGEFFHVVVTQNGVDVAVSFVDPSGRELLTVDGPNGPEGPEPLAVVAGASGTYELRVHAPGGAAGEYTLRVTARRPASAEDVRRAAAMRLYAAAEELRRGADEAIRRQALERYRAALSELEGLEAPLLEGRILRRIGQLLYGLGEVREAVGFFERARRLLTRHSNGFEVLPLYNDAGNAYRSVGEAEKALRSFAEALQAAEAIDSDSGAAAALSNLGLMHHSLGELQAALTFYDRSLAVHRELGDPGKEATILHNIGTVYASLGKMDEGLDFLRRSLDRRQANADRAGQAAALTAMGWIHHARGDSDLALASCREAVNLYQEAGNRQAEAFALDLCGRAYTQAGRHREARQALAGALATFVASGSRLDQAHTLRALGDLERVAGKPEAAVDLGLRSLEIFRQIGILHGEAAALVDIARAQRDRGRLKAAAARFAEAFALVESLRGRLRSGSLRGSYLAQSYDDYGAWVDLLMELDRREPGQGYAERAFEVAERGRARSLLESLAETGPETQPSAVEAVETQPSAVEAVETAPSAVEAVETALDGVSHQLLERRRTLARAINARELKRVSLAGAGTPPEVAAADELLRRLLIEYEKLAGDIRDASRRAGRPAPDPQPLTLKEIREQILDDDTLLLSYRLGEERSFLWVVGRRSFDSYLLPPRIEIDGLARRLHQLLQKSHERSLRVQVEIHLTGLSDAVLVPALDDLDGKRLAIVADGGLQSIPFAVLPLRGQPLLAAHEVVHLPSASALAMMRRDPSSRRRPEKQLVVVADPVFQRDDPRFGPAASPSAEPTAPRADAERSLKDFGIDRLERLAYSGREAEAILTLVPESQRFAAIGFAASREWVLSGELGRYRIVHFATHGLLNERHPALSGIALSQFDEAGHPRDGFLWAHELPGLDLSADLVVLSACRTALGKEMRGEGVLGMTRGFFKAGAPRVVVGYWGVADRATAVLMTRFYRGMLVDGLRPAAALRAAQLSMLAEPAWRAPYYWAAFALQGEWR